MFALLPRTRGMGTANSFAFKFETAPASSCSRRSDKDSRIGSTRMQKARWFTFELSSDTDLHERLDWLVQSLPSGGQDAEITVVCR